jgi:hypothetical protein
MRGEEESATSGQCGSNWCLRRNLRLVMPYWIEMHGTKKRQTGDNFRSVTTCNSFVLSLQSSLQDSEKCAKAKYREGF